MDNKIKAIRNAYCVGKKIYIWGICSRDDMILSDLSEQSIEIAGFIDRKASIMSEYNGYKVYDKSVITKGDCFVYISLKKTYPDIIDYLTEIGLDEFEDYWYPKREIFLDGRENYSDQYGNCFKKWRLKGNPSIILSNGSKIVLGAAVMDDSVTIRCSDHSEISLLNTTINTNGRINCYRKSKIQIGDSCFDKEMEIECFEKSSLYIGSKTKFEQNCRIRVRTGSEMKLDDNCNICNNTYFFIAEKSKGTFSNNLSIGIACNICSSCSTNLVFGEDCMLSNYISVFAGNGHSLYDLNSKENLNVKNRDIILGKHVWVGIKSTLISNTQIGSGSIVGAHSLVNSYFPDNTCIAGNPAKVIRTGVAWRREDNIYEDNYEDFAQFDFR